MRVAVVTAACAALLGCSPSAGPPVSAGSSAAADDSERGELLSLACQACHSFGPGGAHLVGPNLAGVFGRTAGTAPGFDNYSEALKRSGIVWSPAVLDRWLADPAGFLPGTTMAFTGYQAAQDRAALLAFLTIATGAESPGDAE